MVANESIPANKNMFRVGEIKKALELFQLILFGSLLISLEHIFIFAMQSVFDKHQTFNLNGSSRVCFYFQTVMKSVLVKLQAFAINGSDEVCDEAYFFHHALVACF